MNQREDKRLAILGPEKKQLSPLKPKPSSSSSIIPTQNRFSPITPIKRQLSYSTLVQTPVTISPTYTPTKPIVLTSTQTVTPYSPKNTRPSSSRENSSQYVQNPNQQTVKILEDEEMQIYNQGFQSLTDFLFPKNSMFIGSEMKPREYYQAVLENTGSIKVTHISNSPDKTIAFSKVHILHVMTIQEWKARPYTDKSTNYPKLPYFNYYDYQDAWYNLFYLKNYSHSWFICFNKEFECSYPRWFVRWFRFLGNIPETLPNPVFEGFQKFKEIFHQDVTEFEYLLQFSILFKIPWIMSWTFSVIPTTGASPNLLQRIARVKWWDKLPADQIPKMTVQGVSDYYSLNYGSSSTKAIQTPKPEEDDEDKELEQFLAMSSREDLKRLINKIKQESSSGSSTNQDTELIQDAQDPFSDVSIYE